MKNHARLKELGLPDHYYNRLLAEDVAGHSDKNQSEDIHSDKYDHGDSESEYDPLQDDNGEEGLIDHDNAKCSKEKTCKKTNNQTTSMRPGGVKFQSRKRVFADQTSPRVITRSKKNTAQQDASLTPSDICVPPPSGANESHTRELVGNLDEGTQAAAEGDISALLDNSHETSRADAIDQPNQHSHMENGEGFTQHDDNTLMANVADGITQHGDHTRITNEGGERRDRGHNMGRGLQRLNRARRGQLQVVITEGNIRPVVPLVAAKFASECNIIVRNHVPILTHWKLYKEKPASAFVDLFIGNLKAKFDINTNDEIVKKACIEMMKSVVRQQRYRLKREYFDPYPLHLVTKTSPLKCMTNEQWIQLLESWKSPQKMEMCQKNKDNRGNVKYHHTTGSRAYMVHVENLEDKYNEEEPNAFDLFKELHYSKKKKCYAPAV
ncbi:hypothetical protein BDA96_06G043800 [Sorghum bicolor]|uniref:Uncharacterized protein n=1 Tax=Sorghum bicolor TaxID=4558 RepID=A0A921QR02_SORBI|nr:hypothetical protein BDA96_06G043800 [Sorghum bicolor]